MSSSTDALSTKELALLISTSQMLFYNLISPIELKQGLIADKRLLTFVHTKEGVRVSTLHLELSASSPYASNGKGLWFLHVSQEYLLMEVKLQKSQGFLGQKSGMGGEKEISVT